MEGREVKKVDKESAMRNAQKMTENLGKRFYIKME